MSPATILLCTASLLNNIITISTVSAVAVGINEVNGLSVINLNTNPRMNTIVPVTRNTCISSLLGLNITDTRRAAPTTDMRDISANTEERNENRYNEPIAETTIPRSMYIRVELTDIIFIFLMRDISTPNAKALESIVPINAAIREMVRSEASQAGSTPSTPSVKRVDGSVKTPENLKLIPKIKLK